MIGQVTSNKSCHNKEQVSSSSISGDRYQVSCVICLGGDIRQVTSHVITGDK